MAVKVMTYRRWLGGSSLFDEYFIGKIKPLLDNTSLLYLTALAFESHTIYSHSISSPPLLIGYAQAQYHPRFD